MKKQAVSFFFCVWVLSCWGADSTFPTYDSSEQLPMVVLICSYNNAPWVNKNLDSVFNQKYDNYRILYIDDCSKDNTVSCVQSYKNEYDYNDRLTLIANSKRCRKMKNMYNAVHSCQNHEIIVQLDGDDWFCDDQLLARINHMYQTRDVWLTYGSYIDMPDNIRGYAHETDLDVIKKQSYRKSTWLYMPTRTFYAWLFKAIQLKDFIAEQVQDYQGLFYPSADDPAFMFPMLEMAGDRFAYIHHISYVANRGNPIIGRTLEPDLQGACGCDVRYKKKYPKLPTAIVNERYAANVDMLIFSENNPAGLAELLGSIEHHAHKIAHIGILYEASEANQAAYNTLKAECNQLDITFFSGNQIEECIDHLSTQYVLVAHDTVYLKKNMHVPDYLEHLEKTGAYGFYFAYAADKPPFNTQDNDSIVSQHIYQDIYAWKFNCGRYAFFNNCDMTLLRKSDLILRLNSAWKNTDMHSSSVLQELLVQTNTTDLHQVGLISEKCLLGGTCTDIDTAVILPQCLKLPPGRGYRTPMDIERKRCRKIRLTQERTLVAEGILQKNRRIKKRTMSDSVAD